MPDYKCVNLAENDGYLFYFQKLTASPSLCYYTVTGAQGLIEDCIFSGYMCLLMLPSVALDTPACSRHQSLQLRSSSKNCVKAQIANPDPVLDTPTSRVNSKHMCHTHLMKLSGTHNEILIMRSLKLLIDSYFIVTKAMDSSIFNGYFSTKQKPS